MAETARGSAPQNQVPRVSSTERVEIGRENRKDPPERQGSGWQARTTELRVTSAGAFMPTSSSTRGSTARRRRSRSSPGRRGQHAARKTVPEGWHRVVSAALAERKQNGAYYTDEAVARFLVSWALPHPGAAAWIRAVVGGCFSERPYGMLLVRGSSGWTFRRMRWRRHTPFCPTLRRSWSRVTSSR